MGVSRGYILDGFGEGFSDQLIFPEKELVASVYEGFSDQSIFFSDGLVINDGSFPWSGTTCIRVRGGDDSEPSTGLEGIGGESSLSFSVSETSSIAQQASRAFDTFQVTF